MFAVAVIGFSLVSSASAADALFPQPLHIVRRVEDPLAGTTVTLHEYCAGDQVVTVNGSHVAIADYGKQQLTEIDRDAGTYSITRFEDLAKATASAKSESSNWKSTPLGVKAARSGRSLDSFALTKEGPEKVTIEIGIDRATRVSRAALEVLIGASYPNPRREEHDAIIRAAAGSPDHGKQLASMSASNDYALPYEETLTIEAGHDRLIAHNSILEVRNDLPPDDVKLIPPGARQVESRTTRLAREMLDLDQLPARSPH